MYLLCDIVSFGKINLKNLKKLQKLDINGDNYVKASGLKKQPRVDLQIHDQITHRAIPNSIKKYLPNADKVKYTAKAKRESFLPLINPNNQLKKGLNDKDLRYENNRFIERIANTIEGKGRDPYNYNPASSLGQGIRKKKLTKVQKLATNMQTSPLVEDLITTQRKPTQDDVTELIQQARARNNTYARKQQPKQRGSKPTTKTVEEKRNDMRRKYGIR